MDGWKEEVGSSCVGLRKVSWKGQLDGWLVGR